MAVTATVLFGTPQQEIAPAIQSKLATSDATSIVTGFLTAEGIRLLEAELLRRPAAVQALVIGAGTYQAFSAIDQLLAGGVLPQRILFHMGHTRLTTSGATHRFYRYHPMLHSKIYYMEHAAGSASAFVGSHNVTGFALDGLNGEASILLEGRKDEPEFAAIRNHIQAAIQQSAVYSPAMKDAYAWWSRESLAGISDVANDFPRDGEAKRTIVIVAEAPHGVHPNPDDLIYFELPAALGRISTLRAEVHIYLFDQLPPSPSLSLTMLASARQSLWCQTRGLELERGGLELRADWQIRNANHPSLAAVSQPFRPTPASDMQQVRVRVRNEVWGEFEYLFDSGATKWLPILDETQALIPSEDSLRSLSVEQTPNPLDREWYKVVDLVPAERGATDYDKALLALSPAQESYVMMSLRRRALKGA